MTEPRIAIVGAGVGGLVTARTLQLHGYSATLFEREASRHARWQGGMLDLHAPTGQVAMRAAGLFAEWESLARPEAQEMRRYDPITAELIHQAKPADAKVSAPEIDRGQLRDLLLDSLAPGTVHWGQSIDSVTPLDDGTARLRLRDGSVHDFDLVIGADGAWSKVRRAVSDSTPAYMGSTLLETALDDVDNRHPELAELIGPGSAGATSGHRVMLSAQRNSDGHVRVYAGFDMPADWYVTEGVDLADADAVRDYLLGRFEGWHPLLLDLIRRHDEEFINRALHILPIGHSWTHVPGITLVGDAAHLMPP
ncbi:MAG TPA: NAD(P)/FAD-dependent oxidoreductase, partial [Pseudonocardiaceae bacterium]